MSEVSGSGQSPNSNPTPRFETAAVPVWDCRPPDPLEGRLPPSPAPPGRPHLPAFQSPTGAAGGAEAGAAPSAYPEDEIVGLLRAFSEHRHSTDVRFTFWQFPSLSAALSLASFAACHLMLPPGETERLGGCLSHRRGWERRREPPPPASSASQAGRAPSCRWATGGLRSWQALSRSSYLMFIVLLLRGMFKGFLWFTETSRL